MSEPKYPLKTNGNNISNAIDFISGISDGYKAALELSNHFTKRASDSSSQSKEKLKTGKGLLYVIDKNGDHLFTLKNPNSQSENQTIKTPELYEMGIQWFAPKANNYAELTDINPNIKELNTIKHYTPQDIIDFADKHPDLYQYHSGGEGDWKKSPEGGNGYWLTEIDGKPYWSDAIGQIPYAINAYRNTNLTPGIADFTTSYIGKFLGNDDSLLPFDFSNSYDNAMIRRTIDWMKAQNTPTLKNKIQKKALSTIFPEAKSDVEINKRMGEKIRNLLSDIFPEQSEIKEKIHNSPLQLLSINGKDPETEERLYRAEPAGTPAPVKKEGELLSPELLFQYR